MEPIARQVWKAQSLAEKKRWGERAILQLRREKQEQAAREQVNEDPFEATIGHGTLQWRVLP